MGKIKKWQTLSSKLVFDNKWYKVRQDTIKTDAGKIIDDYFLGLFHDVVLVAAFDSRNQLILVRQYKHGAGEILLEVPAGYVDENEKPLEAAKRELKEETGYVSEKWQKLGVFFNNPTKEAGGQIHIFLAQNCQFSGEGETDDNENIEVVQIKQAEIYKKIIEGEIKVCGSVTALFLALKHLKKI